jgi:hypothetical protein
LTATMAPSSCQTRSKSVARTRRRSAGEGSVAQKPANLASSSSASSNWGSNGAPAARSRVHSGARSSSSGGSRGVSHASRACGCRSARSRGACARGSPPPAQRAWLGHASAPGAELLETIGSCRPRMDRSLLRSPHT